MTVRQRSMTVGFLFAITLFIYFAAKQYSPALIFHGVKQPLIQKAPAGADPDRLRKRLHAHIAALPDDGARVERLLRISEYLEKMQHLTARQLDELLAAPPAVSRLLTGRRLVAAL